MQGVLPPEELPSFFAALERLGSKPRKSIRLRRDLSATARARWTPEKLAECGIPLEERVGWYEGGFFFDLPRMEPHPSRHPAIASGLVFIQEAGAMEVVPALEVSPGDLVLDLCAAPGAKSTHIGEYLSSDGWLVANEPVRDRAKLLDVILARHGIGNSTVFNREPHHLAAVFPEIFDRILVDAPCSGESLFAKRNEKRKDVTHKEVARCALRQRAILESAWRMLAPGGRLVYSTCAYSRPENEDLVRGFLGAHSDAESVDERRRFPHRDGVPGGYFAVLTRKGHAEGSRGDRRDEMLVGFRKIGSHGLVRDGRRRWDGKIDAYATLMDRKRGENSEAVGKIQDLDLEAAAGLLSGEAPPRVSDAGDIFFQWEGERIAGATEGTLHYPRGRLR